MEISDLTHTIIGRAYKIHTALGPGFAEEVYENALRIELEKSDIQVKQQDKIAVLYEGQIVGTYRADLFVDGRLIVEVKAVRALVKEHEVQLVNYLTATGFNDGLLLNFGPSIQVKRKFREYKPPGTLLNTLMRASH